MMPSDIEYNKRLARSFDTVIESEPLEQWEVEEIYLSASEKIQKAWNDLDEKPTGSSCYVGSSRFIKVCKNMHPALEEHREGWSEPFYHY